MDIWVADKNLGRWVVRPLDSGRSDPELIAQFLAGETLTNKDFPMILFFATLTMEGN